MYSNGLSEIILGKAIKQFNFPRGEIVVMTKVSLNEHSTLSRLHTMAMNYPACNNVGILPSEEISNRASKYQ